MAQYLTQPHKLSNLLLNTDSTSLKEKFEEWLQSSNKTRNILVTGKTGVGKSRLVNALVGRPVAAEGRTKDSCKGSLPVNTFMIMNQISGVVQCLDGWMMELASTLSPVLPSDLSL